MIEEPPLLTIKRNPRRPSEKQIAGFQGVATGNVVDAMFGDGALSASIRPIGDGRDIQCIAAGPALTADCGPADILGIVAALNFIQPGDILVAAFAAHQGCAAAGDRVIGVAKNNGAAGFVTDGPVRDYAGIVAVNLPVWCTGLTPASPFTKGPARVGLPVQLGGQSVASGDMIVADADGVVVVPFERIDEVLEKLATVRKLEAELDQKVTDGQKVLKNLDELAASMTIDYVD